MIKKTSEPAVPVGNLDKKSYAVFDRTYMAFGSVMNGLQHRLATMNQREVEVTVSWAWGWAQTQTETLLDKLYNGSPSRTEEYPL
jgi:hypothetical protein